MFFLFLQNHQQTQDSEGQESIGLYDPVTSQGEYYDGTHGQTDSMSRDKQT
jgi:hypothetical protein